MPATLFYGMGLLWIIGNSLLLSCAILYEKHVGAHITFLRSLWGLAVPTVLFLLSIAFKFRNSPTRHRWLFCLPLVLYLILSGIRVKYYYYWLAICWLSLGELSFLIFLVSYKDILLACCSIKNIRNAAQAIQALYLLPVFCISRYFAKYAGNDFESTYLFYYLGILFTLVPFLLINRIFGKTWIPWKRN